MERNYLFMTLIYLQQRFSLASVHFSKKYKEYSETCL